MKYGRYFSIVHSTQTLNNKTTNMDNAGDAVQKVKGAGHDAAQAMDRNDARVQRKINPRWARAFGRIGYITRGVIYIIIGALAMTACWSKSSPDPDKNGVVELLASQPGGQWILWILIVGLYAYALWRLYEAISGISDDPSKKRWKRILTKRLLPIWSAILYAYFATSVVLSLTGGGSGTSGGSGGAKKSWSSKILNAPGGIAFFIIVGIFFALSGFFQLKNAIRGKFRNQLKEWEIPLWARRLVMILGYLGYVGRAITYFLIAYLYFKVAGDRTLYDLGLGGALMELQDNAGGKVWLFLISILLICFGAFSIVLAKYKDFLKHSKVLPK